jgi:GT2 family glycosyltransferase
MKHLSIIILTYNSEKDIYPCLESVYQHNDIGEGLEVIVVDNQSKNFATMQQEIAKYYPEVIITQNTHNGGYGQGNNVGIRIAQAPVVAIMNPDVRLMQPIFAAALQALQNDTIMCGGKQMHTPTQLGWSYAFDYNAMSYLQVPLRNFYKRFDYYDYRHMHLSGAFFFIKKKCFEQIGMFDEQIFMYGEECDIHLRLRKVFPKKKIKFLPLPYLHLSAERPFEEKRYRQLINADLYVCRKHGLSIAHYLRIRLFALRLCLLRCKLQGRGDSIEAQTYPPMIEITKEIMSLRNK